jgi:hypothetical protein
VMMSAKTAGTRTHGAGADDSGADGAVGKQVAGTEDTATRMGKAAAILILSLRDWPLRTVVGASEDPREMGTSLHARVTDDDKMYC